MTNSSSVKAREPTKPRIGEFEVNRPTPSQDENDQAARVPPVIVSPKRWDLSPVDPQSWDPTEPPGRPT
jgi:hypothetical protein